MLMNRQMLIAALPDGALKPSDFELRETPEPEPGEGQVLVHTVAITIGAGQRAGLQGSASYAGAPEVGRVMGGSGVGTIEASNHPRFAAGDLVRADTGWQEYSVHDAERLGPLDASVDPADHLGVLGINGLTAYFGLTDIGRPQPGDTVLVSAAAGSVGHLVGQMAKVLGARVVGVVGSDDKARMLVDRFGFDAALNRRGDDFRSGLKDATPKRVDVYFDNTGGPILESALFRMNTHGRIVCCGAASQYDTTSPGGGPRGVPGLLVNNRVRMEGFLVFDYASRYEEGRAQMRAWMESGQLKPESTEYHGLEQAPQAFVDLLAGVTVGTTIVRV
jgi:NADPH-dependent curcumin reductase CurA